MNQTKADEFTNFWIKLLPYFVIWLISWSKILTPTLPSLKVLKPTGGLRRKNKIKSLLLGINLYWLLFGEFFLLICIQCLEANNHSTKYYFVMWSVTFNLYLLPHASHKRWLKQLRFQSCHCLLITLFIKCSFELLPQGGPSKR